MPRFAKCANEEAEPQHRDKTYSRDYHGRLTCFIRHSASNPLIAAPVAIAE